MPFIRKDFTWQWDILALAFILVSLYMLTERAVTMFFLAGAIAFGAGYFVGECVHILDYFGKHLKKYRLHAKMGMFGLIMLVFFGFNAMVLPSSESFGFDVPPEWVNLFDWVNGNLAQGSVITAWWDYGHWLSYYCGDRISVTTDNAQYAPSIYTTAIALTHAPCERDSSTQETNCDSSTAALEQSEIEALSILKPIGTTHILVDKEIVGDITGGKFGALTTIANTYLGCVQSLSCSKNEDGSAYCYFGKNSQGQDVGLTFTVEEWTQMREEPWPGVALTSKGLPTRAFVREDSAGANIYMSALGCGGYFQPNANSPVLFAFLQRLFFEDENLKHVKLVYKDGWNVIYEVDWRGIPDPETSVLPDFKENLKVINERLGE